MKHIFFVILFSLSAENIFAQVPSNFDFENGNTSGWQINISNGTVAVTNKNDTDSYGNFPTVCPWGGQHSLKLGNDSAGIHSQSASFVFVVTPNNFYLELAMAKVFKIPVSFNFLPTMRIEIWDSGWINNPNSNAILVDTINANLQPNVNNGAAFSDWKKYGVQLNNFIGHRIIVKIVVQNFSANRFGYGYFDFTYSTRFEPTITFCKTSRNMKISLPDGMKNYAWFLNRNHFLGNDTFVNIIQSKINDTILFLLNQQGLWDYPSLADTFNLVLDSSNFKQSLKANFTFNQKIFLCTDTVFFHNSSSVVYGSDSVIQWQWDFGDIQSGQQNFSSSKNPSHIYQANGTYAIQLIVSNISGCMDTIRKTVFIGSSNPQFTSVANDTTVCFGNTVQLYANGSFSAIKWLPSSYLNNNLVSNPITNPTTSIKYFVTARNSFGCTISDSVLVQVRKFQLTSISNDTAICRGTSVQLQASGSFVKIKWTPNFYLNNDSISNPITNPAVSTNYFVSVTDSFGCKTTDNIFVKVNQPIKPVISLDSNFLISTFAKSYQWYFGGFPIAGEINQTTLANQKGNYLIETIDTNGCKSISAAYYNNLNVGVEEFKNIRKIKIYPNPTNGLLYFENLKNSIFSIELFDAVGEKIISENLIQKPKLDLNNLSNGVYYLRIIAKDFTEIKKVVLQK